MTVEANPMRTTAVIIGAGQAGLALSRNLTDRSVEHVVLESDDVAETERSDSRRLLTTNLSEDQGRFDAPVVLRATVTSVRRTRGGYTVSTTNGTWKCEAVVVDGACRIVEAAGVGSN